MLVLALPSLPAVRGYRLAVRYPHPPSPSPSGPSCSSPVVCRLSCSLTGRPLCSLAVHRARWPFFVLASWPSVLLASRPSFSPCRSSALGVVVVAVNLRAGRPSCSLDVAPRRSSSLAAGLAVRCARWPPSLCYHPLCCPLDTRRPPCSSPRRAARRAARCAVLLLLCSPSPARNVERNIWPTSLVGGEGHADVGCRITEPAHNPRWRGGARSRNEARARRG
ncbi:hypothetical protein BJ912DRAFT_484862 [Pholiota molesta]|nr:hypothetical protein BJ912DRAFT_484862 [Pholiota molesta]